MRLELGSTTACGARKSGIVEWGISTMLILIILLLLLFGGGFFGYNRYGSTGGIGIGGVILIILLLWLFLGGGRADLGI